jgi:hypothetical protein
MDTAGMSFLPMGPQARFLSLKPKTAAVEASKPAGFPAFELEQV